MSDQPNNIKGLGVAFLAISAGMIGAPVALLAMFG
jgi:hypothetical protein